MEKIINSLLPHHWIAITHPSDIAAARRAGQRMAQDLGFDDTRTGQLAIIISEAASNILKHAGDGHIHLSTVHLDAQAGIDVLAFDRGPGIANLGQSLRDGSSSTGTAGTGLGAMRRLADQFEVYAPPGKGTVVCMRVMRSAGLATAPRSGALCLPLAGETASGDAWAMVPLRHGAALMLVDGLGHGPEAAKAARAALDTWALQPGLRPADQIHACHQAMRATRGAALAVALVDEAQQQLHFAGVGNISASYSAAGQRRHLVSHNGIVGHNMRKVQEFSVPCEPGALVVLHSDGIGTRWDLEHYPGLAVATPAAIAAVLLRDDARGRDDACVLVYRCAQEGA